MPFLREIYLGLKLAGSHLFASSPVPVFDGKTDVWFESHHKELQLTALCDLVVLSSYVLQSSWRLQWNI